MYWIDKLVEYAEEECSVSDPKDIMTIRNVCDIVDCYGEDYDNIDMLAMGLAHILDRDDLVACLGKGFNCWTTEFID